LISSIESYVLTIGLFVIPEVALYVFRAFTIFRLVVILFALDTVLTIEAAYYSDVLSIAFLHIVTIPAFFALIYFDLVRNHRNEFRCFLCGNEIELGDEVVSIKRTLNRRRVNANVHASCVGASHNAISEREFRRGIPK